MNKPICCDGAILDLDGVITQTEKVHFKAWKRTFDNYLQKRKNLSDEQRRRFGNEKDYLPYVDGKPRYQGVKSFLDSRDISIPFGRPEDPPGKATICGLGNKKNELFRELVATEGLEIYQSTIQLVRNLKQRGLRIARRPQTVTKCDAPATTISRAACPSAVVTMAAS